MSQDSILAADVKREGATSGAIRSAEALQAASRDSIAPVESACVPLVQVEDAARWFDVSPPWLERVLARKGKVDLRAVDGVTFDIARGETFALVGESGCGKSTVARMLVGLYGLTRGRILFDGRPLSDMETKAGKGMRQRLQMIFQDPYASLNPRWRVGRIIAEPLVTHSDMSRAERTERVSALLGKEKRRELKVKALAKAVEVPKEELLDRLKALPGKFKLSKSKSRVSLVKE